MLGKFRISEQKSIGISWLSGFEDPDHELGMSKRYDTSADAIGARIKHARTVLGISQQSVADACGTGKSTISAWENGKQMPTHDQLGGLAQLVDLPIDFFVLGRFDYLTGRQMAQFNLQLPAQSD